MTTNRIHACESVWQLYDEQLGCGHNCASQSAAALRQLGLASSAQAWWIEGAAHGNAGVSGTLCMLTACFSPLVSGPRLILDLDDGCGGSLFYQPLRDPLCGTHRYYRELA